MKKFVISEQERKNILNLYGLIVETKKDELPQSIKSAFSKLEKKYNVKIEDSHIQNEFNQEGKYYEDNGGVNEKGKNQISNLLNDLKLEFPEITSEIKITSDYRSYDRQIDAFGKLLQKDGGVSGRQRNVALPGFSQHHTGNAFDIISVEPEWWDSHPEIEKWVANNCSKYGFKISYPSDGSVRNHEPWHLLYIGGESTQPSNKVSDKEVDDYYKSDKVDEKLEKKTVIQYKKSNCRASSNYTESPSLEKIESGDSVIRIGHKGEPVSEIQSYLNKMGYDLGKCGVDGVFGPKTKLALEKFQEDQNVTVSSSVNKETLSKLKETPSKNIENKSSSEKNVSANVTTEESYVILKPDSYSGKDVHVFFGGAHSTKGSGANIPYLNKVANIIKPHSSGIIVVLTHHANTLDNVKKYVGDKFGGNVVSIAGFSQGGKETWKHSTDGSLRLVGLIDPSTYDINLQMGSNTYMVCNPSNWGGYKFVDEVRERLKWYCEHKDDSNYSGKIDCPKISHWGFLKYFYDKFGSRI